jgi:phosphoribosyl-AMP cyclohydrolase
MQLCCFVRQTEREGRLDCDQDAVWIKVSNQDRACHIDGRSCYCRVPLDKGGAKLEFREQGCAFDPNEVYGKK